MDVPNSQEDTTGRGAELEWEESSVVMDVLFEVLLRNSRGVTGVRTRG